MLCDRCRKNPATVHRVTTINGQTSEEHLCAACAAEEQQTAFEETLWAGNLFGQELLKQFFNIQASPKRLVCKTCGYTLNDFEREGLLGCSDCYSVFEKEMIPVLTQIHGNTQHKGEVPKEMGEAAKKREEIARLQQEQKAAIAKEDYEQAAKLRDEIAQLKEEK